MFVGRSDALPDAVPMGALLREVDTGVVRRRVGELTWLQVGRRVQLSRRAGWRMPKGTIKVDRSGRWGNPWRIEFVHGVWTVRHQMVSNRAEFPNNASARAFSVGQLRQTLLRPSRGGLAVTLAEVKTTFADATVGCWCGLELDCHGDVYLELANA